MNDLKFYMYVYTSSCSCDYEYYIDAPTFFYMQKKGACYYKASTLTTAYRCAQFMQRWLATTVKVRTNLTTNEDMSVNLWRSHQSLSKVSAQCA